MSAVSTRPLIPAACRIGAVLIGLAALAAPADPKASALLEGWSHQDVGAVAVQGDARLDGGVYAITGTLDIWGKADGFHFVHRPLEGDGQIVARVTAVQNTNNHAKAGVMIRESLDLGFRAMIEGRLKLGMEHALLAAFTWRGTNQWPQVAPLLDNELRGRAAYIVGLRYKRLGRGEEAKKLFEEAVSLGGGNQELAELAKAELP